MKLKWLLTVATLGTFIFPSTNTAIKTESNISLNGDKDMTPEIFDVDDSFDKISETESVIMKFRFELCIPPLNYFLFDENGEKVTDISIRESLSADRTVIVYAKTNTIGEKKLRLEVWNQYYHPEYKKVKLYEKEHNYLLNLPNHNGDFSTDIIQQKPNTIIQFTSSVSLDKAKINFSLESTSAKNFNYIKDWELKIKWINEKKIEVQPIKKSFIEQTDCNLENVLIRISENDESLFTTDELTLYYENAVAIEVWKTNASPTRTIRDAGIIQIGAPLQKNKITAKVFNSSGNELNDVKVSLYGGSENYKRIRLMYTGNSEDQCIIYNASLKLYINNEKCIATETFSASFFNQEIIDNNQLSSGGIEMTMFGYTIPLYSGMYETEDIGLINIPSYLTIEDVELTPWNKIANQKFGNEIIIKTHKITDRIWGIYLITDSKWTPKSGINDKIIIKASSKKLNNKICNDSDVFSFSQNRIFSKYETSEAKPNFVTNSNIEKKNGKTIYKNAFEIFVSPFTTNTNDIRADLNINLLDKTNEISKKFQISSFNKIFRKSNTKNGQELVGYSVDIEQLSSGSSEELKLELSKKTNSANDKKLIFSSSGLFNENNDKLVINNTSCLASKSIVMAATVELPDDFDPFWDEMTIKVVDANNTDLILDNWSAKSDGTGSSKWINLIPKKTNLSLMSYDDDAKLKIYLNDEVYAISNCINLTTWQIIKSRFFTLSKTPNKDGISSQYYNQTADDMWIKDVQNKKVKINGENGKVDANTGVPGARINFQTMFFTLGCDLSDVVYRIEDDYGNVVDDLTIQKETWNIDELYDANYEDGVPMFTNWNRVGKDWTMEVEPNLKYNYFDKLIPDSSLNIDNHKMTSNYDHEVDLIYIYIPDYKQLKQIYNVKIVAYFEGNTKLAETPIEKFEIIQPSVNLLAKMVANPRSKANVEHGTKIVYTSSYEYQSISSFDLADVLISEKSRNGIVSNEDFIKLTKFESSDEKISVGPSNLVESKDKDVSFLDMRLDFYNYLDTMSEYSCEKIEDRFTAEKHLYRCYEVKFSETINFSVKQIMHRGIFGELNADTWEKEICETGVFNLKIHFDLFVNTNKFDNIFNRSKIKPSTVYFFDESRIDGVKII